jgi:outer membrane PBP1 activator LpoA protein
MFMKKITFALSSLTLSLALLAGCAETDSMDKALFKHDASPAPARSNNPSSSIENPDLWQSNPQAVWLKLQQTPLNKLMALQNTQDRTEAGWIKLAIISKRYSVNTKELANQLIAWRAQYPDHPANTLFPGDGTLNGLSAHTPPKNIALLLPLSGKFASLGNATRSGFMTAYYQESAKTGYQQNIAFYDTNNANLPSLYQEAVSKGAEIVIGPLTKEDVKLLSSSGNFTVPTIELNYTDQWGSLANNLYQFGLSPMDEAKQVADKAWETGHTRAIIIAPQSEWGESVAKALTSRWQSNGGTIVDSYYFGATANLSADIPKLLHINTKEDRSKTLDQTDKTTLALQRRQDFDVVFLLAPPQTARQIVPLLKYYYIGKTPIYATSVVYSGAPQPQKDSDLNGVFFCEIPWTLNRSGYAVSDSAAGSNRLVAVGRDAYFISSDLSRYAALPNFPMYGTTGAITLGPQKQFYRRLAWAQFHGGQP